MPQESLWDAAPAEPTKRCPACRTVKPLTDFNRSTRKRDGRQSWCRECNSQRSKRYHRENREAHQAVINERNRRVREEANRKVWEYLLTHPCVDCGETDPLVLEFDHQRDKLADVSALVAAGHTWEKIYAEIQKCDVRCANCHRRRTHIQRRSCRSRFAQEREGPTCRGDGDRGYPEAGR
jgi:hypothetical protein